MPEHALAELIRTQNGFSSPPQHYYDKKYIEIEGAMSGY
jgi:hypothetical protein